MTQTYPRPSLTVDIVVFRYHAGHLEGLLIERDREPFAGSWALPGGFVDEGEEPLQAAQRELLEETSVAQLPLVQCGVFGAPGRDPRGWVVSVAFLALAPPDCTAQAGDDARNVAWHRLTDLPELAFDHGQIMDAARRTLAERAQIDPLALRLLPSSFRTRQARHLYCQIVGRSIPAPAFKAWLRRRQAVERVGPARFKGREQLTRDWFQI